ncbi:MAG: carbohydrate ABC transporter permease [Anaerolineaceae bacterium]|nr:carbohydrate ABC transporter permease [Anaerolineaceae bacterium]
MIIFALTTVSPFLWVVLSSLKTNSEIYGKPFGLPTVLRFENYVTAWNSAHIGQNLLNSLVISTCAVALVVLVGSMAAYVLTRVTPNVFIYTYFTLGIMIPVHTILIPTFILMKNFGLYNTMHGLIILYAVSNLSLTIFILSGFMKSLPREIEEAAILDGCSLPQVFFHIVFPLSMPGIATISILTFLNCWNEYLFAYVLISKTEIKTITQGIYALQGAYNTNYGPLTAGLVLAIIPVLIIYFIFQEQVIAGMTAGAVKG